MVTLLMLSVISMTTFCIGDANYVVVTVTRRNGRFRYGDIIAYFEDCDDAVSFARSHCSNAILCVVEWFFDDFGQEVKTFGYES